MNFIDHELLLVSKPRFDRYLTSKGSCHDQDVCRKPSSELTPFIETPSTLLNNPNSMPLHMDVQCMPPQTTNKRQKETGEIFELMYSETAVDKNGKQEQ